MRDNCCIEKNKLFDLRMQHNLTRDELSAKTGVNAYALWRMEALSNYSAPHCAVMRLVKFFDVPDNYFNKPITLPDSQAGLDQAVSE